MNVLKFMAMVLFFIVGCTSADSSNGSRRGRMLTLPATFRIERRDSQSNVKLALVANRAFLFEVFSPELAARLANRSGTIPLEFEVGSNWLSIVSVDQWKVPANVRWTSGVGCGETDPELPLCNPDGTAPTEPNPFTDLRAH